MSDIAQIKVLIEEQGSTWEQFKAANNERLKQIEERGGADAALVNQVETMNAALTNLGAQIEQVENRMSRPQHGGAGAEQQASPEAQAHRKAFGSFMRRGIDAGLEELEIKAALSTGSDADGGHAVPQELDREISRLLLNVSPIRQIADVKTVGAGYKKLVNRRGTSSGWVGETADRDETATPQLADATPPIGEVYAFPFATQRSLDDIFFDVEGWLADEVDEEFAVQEGAAFVHGDGTEKPKGFLAYPTAATVDGTRAFGTLQHIATGQAAALGANPGDVLIDVVYSLKAGHRQRARWVANSMTQAAYRKVKDGEENYLWRPGLEQGQPATLLGYPITDAEDMPNVAANAFPLAFGDFKAGYLVLDIRGTRVLRDPFTNKPYVGFYTTKRVGGGVVNSEAIKLVRIAE